MPRCRLGGRGKVFVPGLWLGARGKVFVPRSALRKTLKPILLAALLLLGLDRPLPAHQPSAASEVQDPAPDQKPPDDPDSKKPNPKPKSSRAKKTAARRGPPGVYMGRQIADVMSWEGVDWLFRETRVDEEQPEKMLEALKIPKGATVADVGTGAGYHSIRLAKRVGPTGRVLASDVQPEMLRMLQSNAKTAGVSNVKSIRATQTETKLPEAEVDLILMVDVYHECTDPEVTLQGL